MPNDRPWPDIFEDFDARGRLPDGFAFDLPRADTGDVTGSDPDSNVDVADGSTLDASETETPDARVDDGAGDASTLDLVDDHE